LLRFLLILVLVTLGLLATLHPAYGQQVGVNLQLKAGDPWQAAFEQAARTGQPAALPEAAYLQPVSTLEALRPDPGRSEGALSRWFTLNWPQPDTAQLLRNLRQSGHFAQVALNHRRRLHQSTPLTQAEREQQYYHQLIRTAEAWDTTRGDPSIRIGILDTGLEYEHAEFAGQIAINGPEDINNNGRLDSADFNGVDDDGNGYIDDVIGYDFTDQPSLLGGGDDRVPDADPADNNGHGTSVAGVTSARPATGDSTAGIAPGCKLVVLKAFSEAGIAEDDDVARAILYAADNGVDVLNFSFGDIYRSQMMADAVQYAYRQGVTMVASAGNASGDALHYPSGFPEVLSIAGTDYNPETANEFLWLFSNYGLTTDLAAPASRIYSLTLSDSAGTPQRDTLSGTSFAAPMVSAGAALLLSQRPQLTPLQVGGLLATTADDLNDPGWDPFTGGGRLDLAAALRQPGGPEVRLLQPRNDRGSAADSLPVVATVTHPLFERYRLEWRTGTADSGQWQRLAADTVQAVAEQLTTWPIAQLDTGTYTLRLAAELANGKTMEDRVRFVRDTSAPQIDLRIRAAAWRDDQRHYWITYRASDRCRTQLHYRPLGALNFRTLTQDKFVRNGAFELTADQLAAATYEFYLSSTNAAGLTGTSARDTFTFQPQAINYEAARQLAYTIPMGAYLPRPFDLDGDGRAQEVIMSRYDSSLNFGKLMCYRYQDRGFAAADSVATPPILIPKDLDTLASGNSPRLLANFSSDLYILRPNGKGPLPKEVAFRDTASGYFPAIFADSDGDGSQELLARDQTNRYVLEQNGEGFTRAATLPDPHENRKGVGSPRMATGDLDQDGQPEVWFGDFDGNVYAYEYTGQGYERIFADSIPQQVAASEHLRIGHFDDDSAPECFVATHSTDLRNSDFEEDPKYWTLRIYEATGNNQFQVTWQDYLIGHFSDRFNGTTAAHLDKDNREEVLLTAFPRTYLIDYQPQTGYFMRWFGGGLATHHVVGDFNQNGTPEFAIGQGDSARFFELRHPPQRPGLRLTGEVLGPNANRLSWTPLANADQYQLLKQAVQGDSVGATFQVLPQEQTTSARDTAVTAQQAYAYLIQAITGGDTVTSRLVRLTPHPRPRLDSAAYTGPRTAHLRFTQPVTRRTRDLSKFRLGDSLAATSLLQQNQKTLAVSFPQAFRPGTNTIVVDSSWADAQAARLANGPDTARIHYQPQDSNYVYLENWWHEGPKTAILQFNRPLAPYGTNPKHYRLAPRGSIAGVRFKDFSQAAVEVQLQDARIGALGYPLSIIVEGIAGRNGAPQRPGQPDVATFQQASESLSDVFVYPNPVRREAAHFQGCRFANLPAEATITIMTPEGRPIRKLRESDGDGGRRWDLRTRTGDAVAPGVYFYYVSAPGGGQFFGKFSVLEE
jgi:subtilisin family serine protease